MRMWITIIFCDSIYYQRFGIPNIIVYLAGLSGSLEQWDLNKFPVY